MIPYALGLGITSTSSLATWRSGPYCHHLGLLLALSAVKGVGFYYSERVVPPASGMLAGSVTPARAVGVAYASSASTSSFPCRSSASVTALSTRVRSYIAPAPHGSLGATELLRVYLRRSPASAPFRGLRQPNLPSLRQLRGPRPRHLLIIPARRSEDKTKVKNTLRS
jgi:hypothetical protein